MEENLDKNVVQGFGNEWTQFDQSALAEEDRKEIFDCYFKVFPWERLEPDAIGFDLGCGSGRWAALVAPRVGVLHCIDASADALAVAERNLGNLGNCKFHHASVDDIPLPDDSLDFGYSLGVLHHVPDTAAGLRSCAAKLKRGAPFLVYLYFAFDNKPAWYRMLWRISEAGRFILSRAPFWLRLAITQAIALLVYWPMARAALLLETCGFGCDSFPLASYRQRSFYVMRTDALDRFGTRLEQRFTRQQIRDMLVDAGFEEVTFSEQRPYWCAVGIKR